jgi:signal transduction histidine kinase
VGVTAASHLDSETRRFARILEEGQTPSEQQQTAFTSIARQSCQLILRNLRRADELVRSFKQVAVDQASEQRRTFRLSSYLDEILISLHPELKRLPHSVEQDLPDGLIMDTYPGALYQVMVNLIMNSIHHAFEAEQAGTIRIAATADGDWVEIVYSDNGKGMPEDVAEKMFDPFFTTRRGHGGSGLGLHISYNLVTQILGGDIKAETAPGKGARFEIRLPRVISEKQETNKD